MVSHNPVTTEVPSGTVLNDRRFIPAESGREITSRVNCRAGEIR
jgi:hypothetical protein